MYKIHELPDVQTKKKCNQQQLNDNTTYEYSQTDLNLFRLQFFEHKVYIKISDIPVLSAIIL